LRSTVWLCAAALFAGCAPQPPVGNDRDGDGFRDEADCAPNDASVHPAADDLFGDGLDQNCDGTDGLDADGDGYPREDDRHEEPYDLWDCDDLDAGIHPGHEDQAGDAIDRDCDGLDGTDADGDGYASTSSGGEDCDDQDAEVHPGAEEACDGIDNDCSGEADDGTTDSDGDGFADCADPTPFGYDGAEGREHPLSAQLHLHGSLSECDGTMGYHTAQAEQYGVDVLWWSDHDIMVLGEQRLTGFDFDSGSLTEWHDYYATTVEYGIWETSTDLHAQVNQVLSGGPSGYGHYWQLGGNTAVGHASWQRTVYEYTSSAAKPHLVPLLSRAEASLAIRINQPLAPDWQLRISIGLSSDGEGGTNELLYYLASEDLSAYDTDLVRYRAHPPRGGISDLPSCC